MKAPHLSIYFAFAIAWVCLPVARSESIPLKADGGTFVVPILINDRIVLDFTVDSGASDVAIPSDVYRTLIRTGTISKDDLLDVAVYELADGSHQREQKFRIRSLKIGAYELRNVIAAVSPAEGGLLLGQSFLSRLRSWSFDNERHVLLINEGAAVQEVHEPSNYSTSNNQQSVSLSEGEPDYACGAAQTLCREQSPLCKEYRDDFSRTGHSCPGVFDAPPPAPMPKKEDGTPDYSCGAAQNLCRDGSYLCEGYREDFLRDGHQCPGVTDSAH